MNILLRILLHVLYSDVRHHMVSAGRSLNGQIDKIQYIVLLILCLLFYL